MINALRYPGGKARCLTQLLQYFPLINNFTEFREPLCGGLSITLNYAKNVLCSASDLNYELYCFWNQLKLYPLEIFTAISYLKDNETNGRELYNKILSRRKDKLTEFQRAIDFYIINRISFSGLADSGGYSQEAFDKRFTKSIINKLNSIGDLIKNINFYCEDFSYLFEKEGDNVLIYADPPYYSQTKSKLYGKNGDLHMGFDHNRFYEIFTKTKHSVIVTYDDCEFVRDMYKNYNIIPIEFHYSMNNVNSNRTAGKELIIKNIKDK